MKKLFTFFTILISAYAYAQVDVTFQVDMTGQTVSPDGVHIAGSLNGWNTEANQLIDQGDNIYAVTLSLAPGTNYEYKFLNGNAWGTEEAAPSTCTVGGSNRTFTCLSEPITLNTTPFNGCPDSEPTQMVTFSVDMSAQTVSPQGVYIAGSFNAWTPDATMLTDAGNNIYEITLPVFSSLAIVHYKFLNGPGWGQEETPGEGCANGENNRSYILLNAGDDVTIPTATYNGCDNPNPTKTIQFNVDLAGATPSEDGVHLVGNFQGWDPAATMMTNTEEDDYEVEIEVMNTVLYVEYKYLNGNAWGTEETVPDECSINGNRFEVLPMSAEDIVETPKYEIGTCNQEVASARSVDAKDLFTIYPTFATSEVFINWTATSAQAATVKVISASGQVIYSTSQKDANSAQTKIDVLGWSKGIYIVQITTNDTQYNQKIIVQ